MEDTRPLHVYECRGTDRHRILRADQSNQSNCTRCDNPFNFIATVSRNDKENDIQHRIRALATKRRRPN